MNETLIMIMKKMNCTENEALIILNNVIGNKLVQMALNLTINKEYDL